MTDIEKTQEELQQVPDTSSAAQTETNASDQNVQETPAASASYTSTAQIVERLRQIAQSEDEISRQEIDALKSAFYRLLKQQSEEAYKTYIEGGGDPDSYLPQICPDEADFKGLMAEVRSRRAAIHEQELKAMEDNYASKVSIISRIKELSENPDEVNKAYSEFKQLQEQWKAVGNVPAEHATEIWRDYQGANEQFYDTLKLNNELRAYDFKKNLEIKTSLCERAEKLAEEEDIVAAFRALQELHEEYRQTGPVERELREQIWARFKAASTVINKKHQDFFEARKEQEQANLEKKTNLCEKVEAIDFDSLKTFSQWNAVSDEVIALQAEWKTIGYAPQKLNVKIFERFRAACDAFFTRKNEFFRTVRESLNENLRRKEELVARVEAIKDSTEWKKTADEIVAIQKEWRTIGAVPKKVSDEIWKRFNAACDAFFEARKGANAGRDAEQAKNKELKQAIIDRLAAIDPVAVQDTLLDQLKKAQAEWNEIGHVPFRLKETMYTAFREQMDRLYGALSKQSSARRLNRFKAEIKCGADVSPIRQRLLRQRDTLTSEIKTYENNLGFLKLSSKTGSTLLNELERKVEKLRASLAELNQKISALDSTDKEA